MLSTTVPTATLAILLIVLYIAVHRRLPMRPLYPPGPAPSLIIGNLLDTPPTKAWLTYIEWGRTYGMYLILDIKTTDILTFSLSKVMSSISPYWAHTLLS